MEVKCLPTCGPYAEFKRLLWEMLWPLASMSILCLTQTPRKCANVWCQVSFSCHWQWNNKNQWLLQMLELLLFSWKLCSGKWGLLLCPQILHSSASFWSHYCGGRWFAYRMNWWPSLALRWKMKRLCHETHSWSLWFFSFQNVLAVTYFWR